MRRGGGGGVTAARPSTGTTTTTTPSAVTNRKERRNLDVKNYLIKKLLFLSFLIKFTNKSEFKKNYIFSF
jgi:hypothetical protein